MQVQASCLAGSYERVLRCQPKTLAQDQGEEAQQELQGEEGQQEWKKEGEEG